MSIVPALNHTTGIELASCYERYRSVSLTRKELILGRGSLPWLPAFPHCVRDGYGTDMEVIRFDV